MRRWLLPVVLLLLGSSPLTASAGVPSPSTSTVPPCLVVCPPGDISYTVVVRDFGSNPISGSMVWLDFSSCTGFVHCPIGNTEGYLWDAPNRRAVGVTDGSGRVTFAIRGGGVCQPIGVRGVRVYADGIALADVFLSSPDQNGDLMVTNADLAIIAAAINTPNPGADFDCDGTVTNADLAFATNQHGGHTCTSVTGVRSGSWGRLKTIYR